jgi:2-iminobutanoate/2-iminopropanoate deaminase
MATDRKALFPSGAAKPAGPYSPVIISGGFAFVSGQAGADPATGRAAPNDIKEQTRQTLRNIGTLLRAAGCDFGDVVKTHAYLNRAEFFPDYNAVYREFFVEPFPARTTVICTLAQADLLVEIDVIARLPDA